MKLFTLILTVVLTVSNVASSPDPQAMAQPPVGRIVGGTDAGQNEIPYQVSIQTQNGFHFCGGSLLSTTAVLTAAHCVESYAAKDVKVVVGEWNLQSTSGYEQTVTAKRLIIHEGYQANVFNNDIAIITLESPVTLGYFVQTVRLPPSGSETSQGANCIVTGWGRTSEGGSTPYVLQKVYIAAWNDEDCRLSYGTSTIKDTMICAGQEGKDSCQGDSGGPMVCGGEQLGIVSFGNGCAKQGYPGVYTQVSYYISWISINM